MKPWALIGLGSLLSLGLTASSAQADEFPSGDWTWSVDDDLFYAGTENDAGQILAQMCTPESGNCVYVVGFSTNCEEDHSYPAMVNTDQGAASIELLCGGKLDEGGNLMIAQDFEQMDRFVRESARIGFALPMEGDKFKAIRFSLKGSVPALDAMRKFAANASKATPETRKVNNSKDSEVF